MFKSLLIVLCLVFTVYADEGQYSNIPDSPVVDVIGDITKEPEVKAEVEEVKEVNSVDLDNLSSDFQQNIEVIKGLNDQLKLLVEEMKKNNEKPVKMVNPDRETETIGEDSEFNLAFRIQTLEDKVGKIEAGELTPDLDAKVRKIAVEEYEKIQLTIKSKEGTVTKKQVVLKGTETSVQGYSGTFMLNPGETLVAIDGVPVQGYNPVVNNTSSGVVTTHVGATNNTIVNGRILPNRGFMMNVIRPPANRFQQTLSTCRMVNGVQVCN